MPTGPSKRPKDVLDLGRRLVQELNLDETCQTLAKWMAHYLAEQILATEKEKKPSARRAAQARCRDVILRLWAERANLPARARPLGRLDEVLTALQAIRADQTQFTMMVDRAANQMKNPWLAFARDSYVGDKRMAYIAFLTGVLTARFGDEKRWLDEHSKHLSRQERKMIQSLDSWLNTRIDWLTQTEQSSVASIPPAKRTQIILKELEGSLEKQKRAYQQLKKNLKASRKK
jgi:hypothetical protein